MIEMNYPKRLIEIGLPIREISMQARREKLIRQGHISMLHVWWARRPLASCRAVLCAALWPDPADPICPSKFQDEAAKIMAQFWNPIGRIDLDFRDPLTLRQALLDFIADFSIWENSTKKEYLEISRLLTASANEALGGGQDIRPQVIDPFAGGGAIPLEAMRVGANAFASDLNPVAVLLNKVILEYIPRYGQKLADEVKRWGNWLSAEAEKELSQVYPDDLDGSTPIAYLWARTIICEGPGCGIEVPLIRGLWLAKKNKRSVALRIIPDSKQKTIRLEIIEGDSGLSVDNGTVRRGSVTCPICGYTTPVASVRRQLRAKSGGARDSRLLCVITTKIDQQGRFYRLPDERDLYVAKKAIEIIKANDLDLNGEFSITPDETLPIMSGVFNAPIYGHNTWGSLFSPRQVHALNTLVKLIHNLDANFEDGYDKKFGDAVRTCLAIAVSRSLNRNCSLAWWDFTREGVASVFSRQALPMLWDYAEANFISGSSGSIQKSIEAIISVLNLLIQSDLKEGNADNFSALHQILPDDSAQCVFTDPPYYNAVPYADLSDYFYVWLKRMLKDIHPRLFEASLSPKDEEICEMAGWDPTRYAYKDAHWFEEQMSRAMAECRRVLAPNGIAVVVFAHKSTKGWEAIVQAIIKSGWIFTASWPIDTEMGNRSRAQDSAALASSVHLVCRPRENPDGSVRVDNIGYWSDVLAELPKCIHAWLPGLASKGIVGADAIFSCIGPALEIYSRYSRVEKASGEVVTLKEYLEEVWAAVSREALGMIFEGADTTSLEEDARLTAMWLWTLSTGGNGGSFENQEAEDSEAEGRGNGKGGRIKGFVLEYDAARKIAQGLGAHLENLTTLVEVRGVKARLLSVSERTTHLFGQASPEAKMLRKKKKEHQTTLSGGVIAQAETSGPSSELSLPAPGSTVLDRLHQAMLLFSNGRSDALKRFIEEDIGQDQGLWSLAQSLAALYPAGSEERRWVEGVLARKKSVGL